MSEVSSTNLPESAEPTVPSTLWAGLSEATVNCPNCDYDLRGISSETCPECGEAIDHEALKKALTPWAYIAQFGQLRVYWRTVLFVMFRHERFVREMSRPVSYILARRFQWVTVFHVWMAIVLMTVWLYLLTATKHTSTGLPELDDAMEAGWPVILFHVWFLVTCFLATGLPSYWFHPKRLSIEKQNRAVALSYYTCAPLAFLPFAWGVMVLLSAHGDFYDVNMYYRLLWHPIELAVFAGVNVLLVAWFLLLTAITAYRIGARRTIGVCLMLFAMPLLWIIMMVLQIAVLPLLYILLAAPNAFELSL